MNSNNSLEISKPKIRLAGFPASAKTEEARYVLFKTSQQGSDKPQKILQPNKSGSKAWKNCPSADLYSFSELEAALGSDPDLRPALVLDTAGLTCIDIDRALDEENQPLSNIQSLIDSTSGYLEESVSGRGFHLLYESGESSESCPRIKHPTADVDLIEPANGLLILTGNTIDHRSQVGSVAEFSEAKKIINRIFSPAQLSTSEPAQLASSTEEWLRNALESISSQYFERYEDWLKIGMAVHSVMSCRDGLVLWDEFSEDKAPHKYEESICETKWKSFSDDRETAITWQTLAKLADQSGKPIPDLPALPALDQPDEQLISLMESLPLVPEEEIEPTKWLLEGFLAQPSLSMIVAPPKAGKSLLINQLQASILGGSTFLGMETRSNPNAVTLYIDLEMTRAEARSRQINLLSHLKGEGSLKGEHHEDIASRMQTMCLAETDINFTADSFRPFIKQAVEHFEQQGKQLVLVTIDSLYMALGDADESDQRAMKSALREFKAIANEYSIALLLVHHSTKGLSNHKSALDTASGSGVIGRIIDAQLTLREHSSGESVYSAHITARAAEAQSFAVERSYPVFAQRTELDAGSMKCFNDFRSAASKAGLAEIHSRLRAELSGREDITFSEMKAMAEGKDRIATNFRDLGLREGWLIETSEHRKRSKIFKIQEQPNCN